MKKADVELLFTKLEEIKIHNVGMDAFTSTFLGIKYVNRFSHVGVIDILQEVISYFKQRLIFSFVGQSNIKLNTDLPLITFMSPRKHLWDMSWNISAQLKHNANHFYCFKPSIKDQYVVGTQTIRPELKIDLAVNSDPAVKKAYTDSNVLFKKFLKEHKLSLLRMIPFAIHLKRQLGWFQFFNGTFQKQKPTVVYTEYDRFNEIVPLITAAKLNNIPTVTQVHGLLNVKYAYAPLVADLVCCWGQSQANQFIKWSTEADRIFITGATQMSESKLKKNQVQPNDFFDLNVHKIALLATNPTEEIRESLVSFFCKGINALPAEWKGIIRLHPSEKPADYLQFLQHQSRVRIILDDELTYQEALATANLVAIFNSAFGIDSMVKDIPTIQLAVSDKFKGSIDDLVNNGFIDSIKTVEEFRSACLKTDYPVYINEFKVKRKRFLSQYCVAFGKDAAENILRLSKLSSKQKTSLSLD